MKKIYLIPFLIVCATNVFSQITYETSSFGSWDSPSHWVGGVVPPSTINSNDIVNINHNTSFISKSVTNNGVININAYVNMLDGSTFINNGKTILSANGSINSNDGASFITNNYAIDNNGTIVQISNFINNGYLFNQGVINNFQKLLYDGVALQCSSWGTLTNNNVLCNSNAGIVNDDCGSTTTGNVIIGGCATLKNQIMNATLATANLEKSNFKIYPNPAKNQINIDLGQGFSNDSKIEIIDLLGKSILTKNLGKSNSVVLDISNFMNGIYFVKITNDISESVTRKFIKN